MGSQGARWVSKGSTQLPIKALAIASCLTPKTASAAHANLRPADCSSSSSSSSAPVRVCVSPHVAAPRQVPRGLALLEG